MKCHCDTSNKRLASLSLEAPCEAGAPRILLIEFVEDDRASDAGVVGTGDERACLLLPAALGPKIRTVSESFHSC